MKTEDGFFESVGELKFLEMTENYMHVEFRIKLNSENLCYYSIWYILAVECVFVGYSRIELQDIC
jgi:hypothetical protein